MKDRTNVDDAIREALEIGKEQGVDVAVTGLIFARGARLVLDELEPLIEGGAVPDQLAVAVAQLEELARGPSRRTDPRHDRRSTRP